MPAAIAKPLLFAALAAALAAPQPLRACCLSDGQHESCCRQRKQTVEPEKRGCCHEPSQSDRCGDNNDICLCCRNADPRIATATRVSDDAQPWVGIISPTTVLHDSAPILSASKLPAPPGSQSAIPHRILHCSWLI